MFPSFAICNSSTPQTLIAARSCEKSLLHRVSIDESYKTAGRFAAYLGLAGSDRSRAEKQLDSGLAEQL
jgi:hypothetical protein